MKTHKIADAVAGLVGVGIIAIGTRFLLAPGKAAAGFGVAPPTDTDPYLAVKGVRDIGSGLVLLALLASGQRRAVGVTLLAASAIPIGDALVVLDHHGSPATAYGVHGATAAIMLAAAGTLVRPVAPSARKG